MEYREPVQNIRRILHDLAQPLATITGVVDLMLLEMDEQDPFFPEVKVLSHQLEKILAILGEIRRLAREAVEAPRLTPEPPPTHKIPLV